MSFLAAFGKGHTFDGLDKKKYVLSPLSLKELGEFVIWVQYKPYRDALVANLPKPLVDELLKECKRGKVKELAPTKEWLEQASDDDVPIDEDLEEQEFAIGLESSVVREQMVSPEGLHKLFVLSLSVKHSEFLTKPINDIIDLPSFQRLQNILLVINGFAPEEDEEEDEEETEKNL